MNHYLMYTLVVIALLVIVLIIAKAKATMKFKADIDCLFAHSKNISHHLFQYAQLEGGLPEPVKRYFKYVLKDGQAYISYARVKHGGWFKTDGKKDWMKIRGEQYFTTQKPGFIWKGKTALFTAQDMYLAGRGRLVVTVLSLFKVAKERGKAIDKGEILRWLAESVWFPTNLLPGDLVSWIAIDDTSAKIQFNFNGILLFYIVRFSDTGEIVELETERPYGKGNQETWVIKLSGYKEMNGMLIPINAEAIWRLDAGDFSYAKFNVTQIDYNIPSRF